LCDWVTCNEIICKNSFEIIYLQQKLQRNNKEVKIKVNKPSYEKDRGKPSSETRKENSNQLGTQPQHACLRLLSFF